MEFSLALLLLLMASPFNLPLNATPAVLPAPSNLQVKLISAQAIELTWQDNSSNELRFEIYFRQSASDPWSGMTTLPANTISVRKSNLLPGATYFFRMRASNRTTNSEYSNEANIFLEPDLPSAALNRVSVTSSGNETHSAFDLPYGGTPRPRGNTGASISANGRFVVFMSSTRDLSPNDTNEKTDIFVHDRLTKTTVNITPNANGDSMDPHLTANGRYVVFTSGASNLVAQDQNEAWDIFLYDQQRKTTEKISRTWNSQVGQWIEGNANSRYPWISGDGYFVAYISEATNLVPGDLNHGQRANAYLFDRRKTMTTRISRSFDGSPMNGDCIGVALNFDGRYVAFDSASTNIVAHDNNKASDIFVFDTLTKTMQRLSVRADGTEANHYIQNGIGSLGSYIPSLSDNGQFVIFESGAEDLVPDDENHFMDVFVVDRLTRTLTRESIAPNGDGAAGGHSMDPHIGNTGRIITFESAAKNLTPEYSSNVMNVFVRDRSTKQTRLLSFSSTSPEKNGGNGDSGAPRIANDGSVAFHSDATDLITNDTNLLWDVYVGK